MCLYMYIKLHTIEGNDKQRLQTLLNNNKDNIEDISMYKEDIHCFGMDMTFISSSDGKNLHFMSGEYDFSQIYILFSTNTFLWYIILFIINHNIS